MSTQPGEPVVPDPAPAAPPPAPGDAARLVRAAAVFYGGLLILAWLWRVAWAGERLLYAGPAARLDPLADALWGAAAAAGVIAASWWVTRSTAWGERLARGLASLIGRPSPVQVAVLALASGIAEEAFFRGALQPRVGLVAASLLFGLAHFVPRRDFLPWTGFSIAAGFLLGALFEATGNLIAPIVAHVLINGVNLTLLARDYGAGPRASSGMGAGQA